MVVFGTWRGKRFSVYITFFSLSFFTFSLQNFQMRMLSFTVGCTTQESSIRCVKWFWAAVKKISFAPFLTHHPGRPGEASQELLSMLQKVILFSRQCKTLAVLCLETIHKALEASIVYQLLANNVLSFLSVPERSHKILKDCRFRRGSNAC